MTIVTICGGNKHDRDTEVIAACGPEPAPVNSVGLPARRVFLVDDGRKSIELTLSGLLVSFAQHHDLLMHHAAQRLTPLPDIGVASAGLSLNQHGYGDQQGTEAILEGMVAIIGGQNAAKDVHDGGLIIGIGEAYNFGLVWHYGMSWCQSRLPIEYATIRCPAHLQGVGKRGCSKGSDSEQRRGAQPAAYLKSL